MNIVYGSVVIFVVLLPGIVYRKSYLSKVFSRRLIGLNPFEDVFWVLLAAVLIHFLGGAFVYHYTPYKVCFETLGLFVSGNQADTVTHKVFQNFKDYTPQIISYNAALTFCAAMLGALVRIAIRSLRLDLRYQFLRFSNNWHYVTTGECLCFEGKSLRLKGSRIIDLIILDVLAVSESGENLLYQGVFYSHELAPKEGVEYLLLRHVKKKKLNRNANTKPIDSSVFLLPGSRIENINFKYFTLLPRVKSITTEQNKSAKIRLKNFRSINQKLSRTLKIREIHKYITMLFGVITIVLYLKNIFGTVFTVHLISFIVFSISLLVCHHFHNLYSIKVALYEKRLIKDHYYLNDILTMPSLSSKEKRNVRKEWSRLKRLLIYLKIIPTSYS